jgi:hypothetical protein
MTSVDVCVAERMRDGRLPIDRVALRSLRVALLALTLSILPLTTSCGFIAMDMNVVVFNYWPRAMADVYVDGQHVGAGYEQGGGASKISCCSKVKTGEVQVKWMLDGPPDDPLTGKIMSSSARLEAIKPGARYLGVYLYPDGTVALDTAKGIPDDRFQEGKK